MWQIDPVPASALTIALAALWSASGVHKLRDLGGFAGAVAAYDLLPKLLVTIVSRTLPVMEVVVAIGLLPRASREAAALAGALLLGLYALAIAINLWRGRHDLDCGCLGIGRRSTLSMWLLWRNAALMLASLAAGFLSVRVRSLYWIDVLTVVVAVAATALLYAAAEGLADAARRIPGPPAEAAHG